MHLTTTSAKRRPGQECLPYPNDRNVSLGMLSGCLSFTNLKPLNSVGRSYHTSSRCTDIAGRLRIAPCGKWSPLLNVQPSGGLTDRAAKTAPTGWRRWDSLMKLNKVSL